MLWYDGKAEEAADFYVSLFKNSKITDVSRMGDGVPAFMVSFHLDGQDFMALNGGPMYKFTEVNSLFVNCETQSEVDRLWDKLSEGGEKQMCGWLKDRYGLSWQIIPSVLGELMGDPDRVKAGRVIEAMLKMQKLDIKALRQAYDQK